MLRFPDPNKPYRLYTDASDIGIGAVLTQEDEDGERPVCFLSRKLNDAESKYATVEKELLAVVYAFRKLRKYLLDKEFTLYTDNSAVRWLLLKSDPGSRLQRWIVAIQEYRYKVVHLPGKSNVIADALSRFPPIKNDTESCDDEADALYPELLSVEVEQRYEEYLQEVYEYLLSGDQETNGRIKDRSRIYRVVDGNYIDWSVRDGSRFQN